MSYPGSQYPPARGGFPSQPGYAQPGSQRGGMPQPSGVTAAPSVPYPSSSFKSVKLGGMPMPGGQATPAAGYPPNPSAPGYPPSTPGYPPSDPAPGYPSSPSAPGYPPSQSAPGYPPSPSAPGYPPSQSAPGYPPYQSAPGYPPSQSAPGYPPSQSAPGYPPSNSPGYPPSKSAFGYPPSQSVPGYPPSNSPGYPPSKSPSGYPPSQSAPGYPPSPSVAGNPPSTSTPGCLPSTPGYPPSTPGYPPSPQAPGYPPSTPGYPPSTSTPGYPPSQQAPGYPPSTPGYPPSPQALGGIPGAVPLPGMINLNLGGNKELTKLHGEGTVKPSSPFYPEEDAEKLKKAISTLAKDENAVIDVLAARTNQQRQKIALAMKTLYGKDLSKHFEFGLEGMFMKLVLALMKPLPLYDAYEINRAIKGAGTDGDDLIEILCSRNNAEITEMKAAYKNAYGKDLETQLLKDTSGNFKHFLISLLTAGRNENKAVDLAKAKQDAKDLFQAGEARWGMDGSTFNQIMCMRSHEQLLVVFDEYNNLSKRTIEQAISSKMSGDIKKGMLAIVKIVRGKPAFFAEKLYKAMKGVGTGDKDLIRVVVTRCEVDMVLIKEEFYKAYNKSLKNFITADTSGHYRTMLLALIGEK